MTTTDYTRPSQMLFQSTHRPMYREPSTAYVVEARKTEHGDHPAYIAAYVGGHDGVRISFDDPADVQQLIDVLTEALDQYRTAVRTEENSDDIQ